MSKDASYALEASQSIKNPTDAAIATNPLTNGLKEHTNQTLEQHFGVLQPPPEQLDNSPPGGFHRVQTISGSTREDTRSTTLEAQARL